MLASQTREVKQIDEYRSSSTAFLILLQVMRNWFSGLT